MKIDGHHFSSLLLFFVVWRPFLDSPVSLLCVFFFSFFFFSFFFFSSRSKKKFTLRADYCEGVEATPSETNAIGSLTVNGVPDTIKVNDELAPWITVNVRFCFSLSLPFHSILSSYRKNFFFWSLFLFFLSFVHAGFRHRERLVKIFERYFGGR